MELSTISKIINLLQNGGSVRNIAKNFGISHMSVQRIKKKYNIETSVPKLGRPRKIDDRTGRHLANLVISDKDITPAAAIKTLNINASVWTARRCLKTLGAKAAVKKKKLFLFNKNIKRRREFAQEYENGIQAD